MRIGTLGLAAMFWASIATAGGSVEELQFPFTPETFGASFDRQAARDGTDPIFQCVEVHRVSKCNFQTTSYKRAAPAEASTKVGLSAW